ncbi:MAG TPA: HIT domain-containing protein [Micromonosporaceae bacterium]
MTDDRLDRLWTPQRLTYVKEDSGAKACPFCLTTDEHGEPSNNLVVARGDLVFAVMNLYPYNPGHLLICPYRHVPDYTDLSVAEAAEFAAYTQTAMRVIRATSSAHGFNIGMNQGAIAGAGIAAHLHQHVVPRWGGDTNFISVIGRTKTLPQLLEDTRDLLIKAWAAEN